MIPYRLSFTLPGLPRMQNPSGRPMHWTILKKEKDQWHWAVGLVVKAAKQGAGRLPLKRARVTITRCSSVEPDYDGLVSGGKRILDALVKCGVLENDKMSNIGAPTYLWEKAPRNNGQVKVLIEEIIENA